MLVQSHRLQKRGSDLAWPECNTRMTFYVSAMSTRRNAPSGRREDQRVNACPATPRRPRLLPHREFANRDGNGMTSPFAVSRHALTIAREWVRFAHKAKSGLLLRRPALNYYDHLKKT